MTYVLVGMLQGAVMPRGAGAHDGIATHGIDSCTGLVMISEKHIFLAHMPPAPAAYAPTDELLVYRKRYKDSIDEALARMGGNLLHSVIVSPNTKRELPNGGPVVIRNTMKTVYGIKPEKALGSWVTVNRDGAVKFGMQGTIKDYATFPGGSDAKWLVVTVN